MSVKVMSHVWEKSYQKANKLLVLLALADSANDDGWAYPGHASLAKKARMTRRGVQKILDELEAAGEIVIFNRVSDDVQHYTNAYHLARYGDANAPAPIDLRGKLKARSVGGSEQPSARVANSGTLPSEQPSARVANSRPHNTLLKPSIEPSQKPEEALPLPRPNSFAVYESEIGLITPSVAEKIKDWLKQVPPAWVDDAIKEAALHNKRSWAYVEAILKRWQSDGRGGPPVKTTNGSAPVETPTDDQRALWTLLETIREKEKEK